jgi:hypothetical protein
MELGVETGAVTVGVVARARRAVARETVALAGPPGMEEIENVQPLVAVRDGQLEAAPGVDLL